MKNEVITSVIDQLRLSIEEITTIERRLVTNRGCWQQVSLPRGRNIIWTNCISADSSQLYSVKYNGCIELIVDFKYPFVDTGDVILSKNENVSIKQAIIVKASDPQYLNKIREFVNRCN